MYIYFTAKKYTEDIGLKIATCWRAGLNDSEENAKLRNQ